MGTGKRRQERRGWKRWWPLAVTATAALVLGAVLAIVIPNHNSGPTLPAGVTFSYTATGGTSPSIEVGLSATNIPSTLNFTFSSTGQLSWPPASTASDKPWDVHLVSSGRVITVSYATASGRNSFMVGLDGNGNPYYKPVRVQTTQATCPLTDMFSASYNQLSFQENGTAEGAMNVALTHGDPQVSATSALLHVTYVGFTKGYKTPYVNALINLPAGLGNVSVGSSLVYTDGQTAILWSGTATTQRQLC